MSDKSNIGVEIERKYIIKMPDNEALCSAESYSSSEILQIYLPSSDGETHRIRRRVFADRVECTETRKIRIDKMSSTEIESEISESSFYALAKNPLPGYTPIEKVRHTFIYKGQLFEIDVYPQWRNSAIMETELPTRETQVEFPSFIEIIREVTGDKSYSNAGMSKSFPPEGL